jgi:hypothetical protein
MTLLIDFLCRFSCGLALALCLTSSTLVPGGFFRVNTLVLLGLATFAALLSSTAGLGSVGGLMGVTAFIAWVGSMLWYAERRRGGLICCGLAAFLAGGATAVVADPHLKAVVLRVLSGLLLGLTINAMLLGHWYLNAPGMQVDALRRSIDQTLLVWGLLLTAVLAAVGWQVAFHGQADAGWLTRLGRGVVVAATGSTGSLDQTGFALLWLRWLAGLVGLPVLLVLSRKTLDIPNTQSATGILYVACLAVILGELTAQLLITKPVDEPVVAGVVVSITQA